MKGLFQQASNCCLRQLFIHPNQYQFQQLGPVIHGTSVARTIARRSLEMGHVTENAWSHVAFETDLTA